MVRLVSSSFGTRLGSLFQRYVVDDIVLKLLALLIVTVIWISVAAQRRPAVQVTLDKIDVTLENPPPNLSIMSSEPEQVRVTLQGPEDLLRDLRIATATRTSDLEAYADLTNYEEGVSRIPLKVRGLPEGVQFRRIEPDLVRVNLEPVRTREVQIDPRFSGTLPEGYKLAKAYTVPERVTLVGPESALSKIEKVTTTTVSLKDRTGSFSERVEADIADLRVTVRDQIVLHVDIEEDEGEQTYDVPVTVLGDAPGQADPVTVRVTLSGPLPVLRQLTAQNIRAEVQPQSGGAAAQSLEPSITISGPSAERVSVARVQPGSIRWRR